MLSIGCSDFLFQSRTSGGNAWQALIYLLLVSLAYAIPSASIAAEDCLAYTDDKGRLNCMELFYRNAKKKRKNPAPSAQRLPAEVSLPRTNTDLKGSQEAQPVARERPEDVNAILNNLAGSHSQSALGSALVNDEKERRAIESTRLINACATAYCQYRLAPYQAAVDRYRNDPDNPNKREAESELRWQFRMHANPP